MTGVQGRSRRGSTEPRVTCGISALPSAALVQYAWGIDDCGRFDVTPRRSAGA